MRVRDLTRGEMTPAQLHVAEEAAAGKRGRMPAPLRAWIHSPEFGAHAQKLGAFLRYDTCLGPMLSELAILVTARVWTSQYEWHVHKREALKAGLNPAIVDAIATCAEPVFADEKARVVYDYATTLNRTRTIPQALHDRAVKVLGERGIVELVGVLGYYTLVSMTLNAFDIGVPAGEAEELAP